MSVIETRVGPRKPLHSSGRAILRGRARNGNRGHILLEPEGCPLSLEADPGANTVRLSRRDVLTPDDARRLASALLALADHADFGPGEWRGDTWWREVR